MTKTKETAAKVKKTPQETALDKVQKQVKAFNPSVHKIDDDIVFSCHGAQSNQFHVVVNNAGEVSVKANIGLTGDKLDEVCKLLEV